MRFTAVLLAVWFGCSAVAVASSASAEPAAASVVPADEAALVAKLRERLTPSGKEFVAKKAADFVAGAAEPETIRASASAYMAYSGPDAPMIATLGDRGHDIDALLAITMYDAAASTSGTRRDLALKVLAYLTNKLNTAQPALSLN